jgi:hypothetical protein
VTSNLNYGSEDTVNCVTKDALPLAPVPELIFGLVGPIGVDLDTVTSLLEDALQNVGYAVDALRVTKLMLEIPTDVMLDENPHYIDSFRQRIRYANAVRDKLARSDAMAILAISAIRELREQKGGNEEEPIPSQAYIIRQFKRPEEIKLLRAVYGRQFVQISAYAPQRYRIDRIAAKERASRRGLVDEVDAWTEAYKLVMQDEREAFVHGTGSPLQVLPYIRQRFLVTSAPSTLWRLGFDGSSIWNRMQKATRESFTKIQSRSKEAMDRTVLISRPS